ncbi:MAG: tetratricopeptide repeat protein [Gammaproteobacteria bacterium]|nr:tetratricopeptide repeat protein [Gammaproteobacteria bacterium]
MDAHLTDDEKLAEVKKWWGENGGSIITGVVLGLAVLFGGKAWFAYQERNAETASNIYTTLMTALEGGDEQVVNERAAMLISDYSSTPYAALAALALARINIEADELEAAQSRLQWVMDNSDSDTMRDTARLRMARVLVAMGNLDAATSLLDQATTGTPFDPLYTEVRGDIDVARGDRVAANKAYQAALDATASDSPGRHLLQLKYDSTLVATTAAAGVAE